MATHPTLWRQASVRSDFTFVARGNACTEKDVTTAKCKWAWHIAPMTDNRRTIGRTEWQMKV